MSLNAELKPDIQTVNRAMHPGMLTSVALVEEEEEEEEEEGWRRGLEKKRVGEEEEEEDCRAHLMCT